MGGDFCNEHCLMIEHIKESPMIRSKVEQHDTKLKNFDVWVPKIEAKVDAIPAMLNGFYLKIMLSIGSVNVITIVAVSMLRGS
jgi:hypothetical protein